ncbi:MAG: NUDIX domain-containing protein [Novosphingobium sp.]
MAEPETLTFKPAATVVIFRNAADGGPAEVLMVQRAQEMRFAGGAAVFPGGRIDAADRVLAAEIGGGDADEVAAKIAAVRETLEETGLAIAVTQAVSAEQARQARALLLERGALAPVLERFGWSLDLALLPSFARWCPRWDGAFDTRFFLCDLGTGAVEIAVDATENTRLFWTSAARALEMADSGEISVIFPTRRNLERLAQFASFAETRAHAEVTPIRTISPQRVERGGEMFLTIPEGLGYPITSQAMATVKRG